MAFTVPGTPSQPTLQLIRTTTDKVHYDSTNASFYLFHPRNCQSSALFCTLLWATCIPHPVHFGVGIVMRPAPHKVVVVHHHSAEHVIGTARFGVMGAAVSCPSHVTTIFLAASISSCGNAPTGVHARLRRFVQQLSPHVTISQDHLLLSVLQQGSELKNMQIMVGTVRLMTATATNPGATNPGSQ